MMTVDRCLIWPNPSARQHLDTCLKQLIQAAIYLQSLSFFFGGHKTTNLTEQIADHRSEFSL